MQRRTLKLFHRVRGFGAERHGDIRVESLEISLSGEVLERSVGAVEELETCN